MPRLRALCFPDRDPEFAALVASLSRDEPGPHADNFLTNEDSFPRVAGELARRAPADGVYLGVGPDQNFTYIAHARPRLSFILDHRRRNLRLHLLHKALMSLSRDRVAYLSRLTARDPGPLPDEPAADELVDAFDAAPFDPERLERARVEVAALLRPLGVLGDDEWADLSAIQARLAGPGMAARFLAMPIYPTFGELIRTPDRDGDPAHMLARESTYQIVRDAQLDDRVIPLVGDFAGAVAPPRLADWLRRRGLRLAALYVSDVEFFLIRAGRFGAYLGNLRRLPHHADALLIRSSTRPIDHPARLPGDDSTTVIEPLASFLDRAEAVRSADDLFPDPIQSSRTLPDLLC